MALLFLCGLNGQNNEGQSLFDKRYTPYTDKEKMGPKA